MIRGLINDGLNFGVRAMGFENLGVVVSWLHISVSLLIPIHKLRFIPPYVNFETAGNVMVAALSFCPWKSQLTVPR